MYMVSSTFALELWLHAVASVQPFTIATQDPSTEVNLLNITMESDHYRISTNPSSKVAPSVVLHADKSVQPVENESE